MGKDMRKVLDERGSGVAIYIFTVFVILSAVTIMATLALLTRVDSIKQRAQVFLFHALSDASHVAQIIPRYENGRLVLSVYIPPEEALRSFCTTFGDGVSVSRIFGMQEAGTENCINVPLFPEGANSDFPLGIVVTDFVVVNSPNDPVLDRIDVIRGKDFRPPFIFARIEVPRTFHVAGERFDFNLPVAAIYRPALVDTMKGDFVIPTS